MACGRRLAGQRSSVRRWCKYAANAWDWRARVASPSRPHTVSAYRKASAACPLREELMVVWGLPVYMA
jgi:hypothetical protein